MSADALDTSQTQGEIESDDSRARLQHRWLLESHNRLDRLLTEARLLDKVGNDIDFERLIVQLAEADRLFGITGMNLPRGYTLQKNAGSQNGYYLKKQGGKVKPETLALDVAGGWISEVTAMLDKKLEPRRPKQITGRVGETGGANHAG